jgi:hypothetical protein
MLDSLTYRLPRLFIWLQHDDLHHFSAGDTRLNYMPQTWGLATLPLVQLAGDYLVWVWTFGSWIVLYWLAYDWAFEINGDEKKSKILAFIASSSLFAVLQGASSANDLFAGVMALLALRFVMSFERTRKWHEINWAVLSFCIAAGTKPHFAVFGLPLTIWFFASPSKPWKAFRWAWLPVLMVIWLLCSPAPDFLLNYRTYGSWAGPGQDFTMRGKGPTWNILLGSTMIVWQNIQPPANPVAPLLDRKITRAVKRSGWDKIVPRFNLRLFPVTMVDGAAMGTVASILFAVGVFLALKKRPAERRSWRMIALATGLVCIVIALSRFVSGSSGRAYCGFLYFALPLALVGWHQMRPVTLRWSFYLSFASSFFIVIMYPSHPLWPACWTQHELAGSPHFHRLADMMIPYLKYSERAVTGESLMQAIPTNEESVVLLVGEDRPLLPLLRPYFQRKFLFLPPHATSEDLNQLNAAYVVIGGGADEFYPELCDYLIKSPKYTLVLQANYTSKIVRGPEPWLLYKADTATNFAEVMPPALRK